MRVLITEEIAEVGVHLLREEHDVDVFRDLDHNKLVEIIGGYDALVVRGNTRVDKDVLQAAKRLRVIGRAGVDVDHIDLQTATQKGIIVLNSPQGRSAASIEYTFCMLLALCRRLPLFHTGIRGVGNELRKKVLGVVGLGRVGVGVARRAKAFDMEVVAFDPFVVEDIARTLDIELVDMPELLGRSDFVTLHLPLTEDSRHILNEEAFAGMKDGVKIINCARGGLVDEEALLAALRSGKVAAAALDNLEVYPPVDGYPLCHMDNVIYTAHQAMATVEGHNEVSVNLARGILAALRSEPVANSINIPAISGDVMETIRPYLDLVERMGVLAVHLAEGRLRRFEVKYFGRISLIDTKMLTRAIIKGMLNPILQEAVNYVNAPEVAKSRGITYHEVNSKEIEDFADLISLTVRTETSELRIAGTMFGSSGRIVQINKARVHFAPEGWLLMLPHRDNPGVIGKVGLTLGAAGINIKTLQICHADSGDVNLMIVNTESDVDQDVVNALSEFQEIVSVKKVCLDL
ncbi:MAG: phosphoglycerate dehydrogenase [Peptococcaceae bacterium]|nr:phosphoglycerate dehydrogenase [Peptococcaceae bacterium]